MGVLDKIKNALFEVEYVEVEEPPKKEKKIKVKEPKEENRPIAKKIVLPGKKEDKVEQIEEEELLDEDFEIRPKDETIKEEAKESFKLMDDDDFKVEEDYFAEEPEIIEEDNQAEEIYKDDLKMPKEAVEENYHEEKAYSNSRENKLYGMDNSYKVPVHQYGTYERYEERTYFKPSPIISPIYGILDKNYRKEDVKERSNVMSGSYTKSNASVDEVRNKAYGRRSKKEEKVETKIEVESEVDEDNLMVDLSDKAKPEVKELTVGDAVEYFQDLGLEYNVDYVDASTDKKSVKPSEEKLELEKIEEEPAEEHIEEITEEIEEDIAENIEEKIEEPIKEENADEDDNLFDLIDSMYQENN